MFYRGVLLTALVLSACSGGGGSSGDVIIPAFWSRSGIVVADFNGDGQSDVAVAAAYIAGPPPHPGYAEIYLQSAPGVFEAPARYGIGPDPWGMSAADVNGDGRLDLVIATPSTVAPEIDVITNSGGISLLRQDAALPGRFLSSQWIVTGGAAEDAAIAQLNGDVLADLVVADGVLVNGRALLLQQNPGEPGTFLAPVSLVRQTSSGNFAATSIPVADGARRVAIGDLNHDGVPDVGVVSMVYQDVSAPSRISVLLQSSASRGQFAVAGVYAGTVPGSFIAIGDMNGDGHNDLVLENGPSVLMQIAAAPGAFEAVKPLR